MTLREAERVDYFDERKSLLGLQRVKFNNYWVILAIIVKILDWKK